jgi:NAD(P)-dependent dehydrogenase (short-subunit alcohol dehydrogenase family)
VTADQLAGHTALVSGAGNGLGRAIAVALGKAGARVILTGRTAATLAETAALLPDAGRARVAPADVSSAASVTALRDALSAGADGERAEEIDLLVNNAGIGGPVKEITDIEPPEWDEVFGANVRSIYLMCRAFLPAMYERGSGDVINVASVTGKRPLTRRTPYAASKMAVIGLTRPLAFEAGPRIPGLCGADIDLSAGMIAAA